MKTSHRTIALALIISAFVLSPKSIFAAAGEPVPGAEIYIELEPDDDPVGRCFSDQNGGFAFIIPLDRKIPSTGVFKMKINPPKGYKHAAELQTIKVPFNAAQAKGGQFRYVLSWIPADTEPNAKPAQNRGTFAVSGRSSS